MMINSTTSNEVQTNLDWLKSTAHEVELDPFKLRFICDCTLGRLVKHLRTLGVDCAYEKDVNQHYLLYLARKEDRIVLTKSRHVVHAIKQKKQQHEQRLVRMLGKNLNIHDATSLSEDESGLSEKDKLMKMWMDQKEEIRRKERELQEQESSTAEDVNEEEEDDEEDEVQDEVNDYYEHKYYYISAVKALDQIDEVVNVFKIPFIESKIFCKCLLCNHGIMKIDKESVKDKVYPSVYANQKQFYQCTNCQQIYWGKDPGNERVNYTNAKIFAQLHSYHAPTETTATTKTDENSSS